MTNNFGGSGRSHPAYPDDALLPHRVAIALGSNLGKSHQILEAALKTLAHRSDVIVEALSSYYQTAPVGPPQPDYLNICAVLRTSLSAQTLLAVLLEIEKQFGRVRRERWGPRLLDLDLLLYDDQMIDEPNLQVPHPRMHERAFVLVPLSEIAPDWVHPVSRKTTETLRLAVNCSGVYRVHL